MQPGGQSQGRPIRLEASRSQLCRMPSQLECRWKVTRVATESREVSAATGRGEQSEGEVRKTSVQRLGTRLVPLSPCPLVSYAPAGAEPSQIVLVLGSHPNACKKVAKWGIIGKLNSIIEMYISVTKTCWYQKILYRGTARNGLV